MLIPRIACQGLRRRSRVLAPLVAMAPLIAMTVTFAPLVGCQREEEQHTQAPILGPPHTGWKAWQCGACHSLPVAGHPQTDPTSCAACHGGNGACDPANANPSGPVHAQTDNCITCHGEKHTVTGNCVSCHYASVGGLVNCSPSVYPDGGLLWFDAGVCDSGAPDGGR